MRKRGGAVIRTLPDKVQVLAGTREVRVTSRPIFDETVCRFLAALSDRLRADALAHAHPDLMAFGFWCRAGHLQQLGRRYPESGQGLGLAFHITPANVPLNAAFSFAAGLLAGNSNVVRLPTRSFPQMDRLLDNLNTLLSLPEFAVLADTVSFIRYPPDDAITAEISAGCRARVIWGSDETVSRLRSLPLPPRATELTFPDRYSLAVLEASAIANLGEEDLTRLTDRFYQDTFAMDQDACSSPRLILWQGEGCGVARSRFWPSLARWVGQRYSLEPLFAVDRYVHLCQDAIDLPEIKEVRRWGSDIYCVELKELPERWLELKGRFGYFYELLDPSLSTLDRLSEKVQTVTYFGMSGAALAERLRSAQCPGVDRVVPVGRALDFDLVWDGYDLVRSLSRQVTVA